MSLAKIREDLTVALKSKDRAKADALRLILAALLNAEKEKRGEELKEGEVVEILTRLVKQRRESIEMFRQGDREEQAAKEEAELAIVQSYLPEAMPEEEVKRLAEEAVQAVGATSAKEMGQVMAELMPKLRGQADGKLVSQIVKDLLSG
jgi:uncharacterized protein YqeY